MKTHPNVGVTTAGGKTLCATKSNGEMKMADENTQEPKTITEEELNANYVSKDQMEAIIKQRLSRATAGRYKPEELLDDEDFLSRVVTERGDRLSDLVKNGDKVPSAERIKQELMKTQLEPLKGELDTERKTNEKLRSKLLQGSIRTAAVAAGVHDEMIDLLVDRYAGKVKFDPEHGDFFLVDAEGELAFRSGKTETGQAPYKTIADELTDIKSGGKHNSWFKATARDGIGLKNTKQNTGAVSLEEFEKMSSREIAELAQSDMDLFRALSRQKAERSTQQFKRY